MLYSLIVSLLYLFWFVVLLSILISWDKFVRCLHLCFLVFLFHVSNLNTSSCCLLLAILYYNNFYAGIINLLLCVCDVVLLGFFIGHCIFCLLFCCIVLVVCPFCNVIGWYHLVICLHCCFQCFCFVILLHHCFWCFCFVCQI